MKTIVSFLLCLLSFSVNAQEGLIKKDVIDIGYIGKERPYKIQIVTLTDMNSKKVTKTIQIEYYDLGDNDFFSKYVYINASEMVNLLKSVGTIKTTISVKPKTQSELHYISRNGFKVSAISTNGSWNIHLQRDINNALSAATIDEDDFNTLYDIFQKAKIKLK